MFVLAFSSSASTDESQCETFDMEQSLETITKLEFDVAFSCYDLFAAAYNAWISLGHNADEAHLRAKRSLDAFLRLEEFLGK
jgi:hypothetical protein